MKERVAKWDNLKFVLIFLVVLGHFIDYYETNVPLLQTMFLWIYSFHIPAFLFVSGLMSKKTVDTTPFRTVRVMSLWALYLLCNGLMLLCRAIAQKPMDLHLLGQDHYSWFLFVLPVFYLLTRAIRNLPAHFAIGFWLVVGCLAGYDASIGDMWYLSRTLVFYPFFLIGYYWDANTIINILNRLWVRILSGVFLVGTFAWMYLAIDKWYVLRPLFTGRNSFEKVGEIFTVWGGAARVGTYLFSALMVLALISVLPTGRTFFTKMGARTLQVYVLHRPVLYLMQTFGFGKWLHKVMPEYWWIPFFGTAVVMTFVLAVRWLEPPFAYLMNPSAKVKSAK